MTERRVDKSRGPRKAAPRGDLRRVPTQDRGLKRVEAILDAAEVLFADVGYEATTTEAIAQHAGASIGSLYQFFPNKKALFDALAARYLDRSRLLFAGLVSEGALDMPWPELLDRVIDSFWMIHGSQTSFRAIWIHGKISLELLAAGDEVNREFAARVEQLLVHHAPAIPKKKRELIAMMLVETASALLFVASRRDEKTAALLVGETKSMLRSYVAKYVEEFGR